MKVRWLLAAFAGCLVLAATAARRADASAGARRPLPGVTPVEFEEFRLGSTTSSRSKPSMKGWARPSTARAAPSATTCRRSAAAAIAEVRAGRRGGGRVRSRSTRPARRCFTCSRSRPRLPAGDPARGQRSSRGACRSRCSAPGLVEAIPDDTLLALEDPFDRNRDGVSGRAAIVTDARPAIAASAASAGRRSTPRCSPSAPTPIATRWASPTTVPAGARASASTPSAMRVCDPIPDPEDIRDPRTGARHRQLRELHAVPRAGRRAAPIDDDRAEGRARVQRDRLRACHMPALTTGPSANPLFNRQPVPLFSDLLLHDVGTGDGIEQAAAQRRRDPHAGAVGTALPAAAAARRLGGDHRRRRSGGTPAKPSSRGGGSTQRQPRTRPRAPRVPALALTVGRSRWRCRARCSRFGAALRRARLQGGTRSTTATSSIVGHILACPAVVARSRSDSRTRPGEQQHRRAVPSRDRSPSRRPAASARRSRPPTHHRQQRRGPGFGRYGLSPPTTSSKSGTHAERVEDALGREIGLLVSTATRAPRPARRDVSATPS